MEDYLKTQAFITNYVNENNSNIKHGMKWNRQQLSHLQQAAMVHDIRDTDVVLVNKIKAIFKEKSNDADISANTTPSICTNASQPE